MSLQERLDALKEQSKTRIPPEARAVMERAIDELRNSGLTTRVPKVGQRAPDLTLQDAAGQPVSLSGLLQHGPVVLSFFRGRW
jgi:hypothetical protein